MNEQHNPPSPQAAGDELLALRQFAGLAMQALISREGLLESESTREEYALWSYRMAQAMLQTEKRLHLGEHRR